MLLRARENDVFGGGGGAETASLDACRSSWQNQQVPSRHAGARPTTGAKPDCPHTRKERGAPAAARGVEVKYGRKGASGAEARGTA